MALVDTSAHPTFSSGSEAFYLPQELVDEVVNHMFDDKPTLFQLCMISRTWMISSRHHLFSTITIRSAHYTDGRAFESFIGFAQPRPSISSHIRTIRLVSTRYPAVKKRTARKRPAVSTQTLWNLLDVLENLECIQLLGIDLLPSGLCSVENPLARRFHIRRLLLDQIDLDQSQGNNLHRLFSIFSGIDEIEIDRCSLTGDVPDEVALLAPPTQVKRVTTRTEYPISFLRLLSKSITLLSFGVRTLTSYLSYLGGRSADHGTFYQPIRDAIPAIYKKIEEFRIDFDHVYNSSPDFPSHRFILQECSSLTTLVISFLFPPSLLIGYQGSVHPWTSPIHLIHSAPSTIRHIVFDLRFKNTDVRTKSVRLLTEPAQYDLEQLMISSSFPRLEDVTFVLRTLPFRCGEASVREQKMLRECYPKLSESGKLKFGKQGYFADDYSYG